MVLKTQISNTTSPVSSATFHSWHCCQNSFLYGKIKEMNIGHTASIWNIFDLQTFIVLYQIHTQCTSNDYWLVSAPSKVTKMLCRIEIYVKLCAMMSKLDWLGLHKLLYIFAMETTGASQNALMYQLHLSCEVVANDNGPVRIITCIVYFIDNCLIFKYTYYAQW